MEFSRRVKGRLISAIRVTRMAKGKATPDTLEVPSHYALRPGFEFLAGGEIAGPTEPASPHPASSARD